jgi:hypothetical protein
VDTLNTGNLGADDEDEEENDDEGNAGVSH